MKKYYYSAISYLLFYIGAFICWIMEHTKIYSLYSIYDKIMRKSIRIQDKNRCNGPWMSLY